MPSGSYLGSIFKRYGALIKDHLAAEVKKRGAEHLNWDVSYKTPKHLCRYHGHSIFKGLVTATNNFGEIRVQFFVVTDGHDQMKQAIIEMRETILAYGQKMTVRVGSDKPGDDRLFFTSLIPELQQAQDLLNNTISVATPPATPDVFDIDANLIKIGTTALEINTLAGYMQGLDLETYEGKMVLSFDAEWDVNKTAAGHVIGQGKLALMQFSFRQVNCVVSEAVLLRVNKYKTLPNLLLALFADPKYVFVGRVISGDLNKVSRCTTLTCGQRLPPQHRPCTDAQPRRAPPRLISLSFVRN